jgi:hypothetical protein
VFDHPGIGIEDLPWIYRDEFVHYVELAHTLGDPRDWPRFRQDLARALTAAFGLATGPLDGQRHSPAMDQVLEVLDEVCRQHDPASAWSAFFEQLWSRRHAIRPDLP